MYKNLKLVEYELHSKWDLTQCRLQSPLKSLQSSKMTVSYRQQLFVCLHHPRSYYQLIHLLSARTVMIIIWILTHCPEKPNYLLVCP